MDAAKITILNITSEELSALVSKAVQIELAKLPKPEAHRDDDLLTEEEVMSLVKCSRSTIFRARKNGLLDAYGTGTLIRFKRSDVVGGTFLKKI